MKQVLIIISFFILLAFARPAAANQSSCVKALDQLMTNVEQNVRSMPKSNATIHKYCVMWLYNRTAYDSAKQKAGDDPCPSSSEDWRKILKQLTKAYSSAKSICGNKNTCSEGCGKALSIIRSGGSQTAALAAIPK